MAEDPYQERVSRIFERIHNIQSNVEDEKQHRFKLIEQVLNNFEASLNEVNKVKFEKMQYLQEKLKSLQNHLEVDAQDRIRMEQDIQSSLSLLERNGKRMIEAVQKERVESDQKLVNKLSAQLEALSTDMQREYQAQASSHGFLQQYLQEDLPMLRDEISNEVILRRDVEQKIFDQFIEQINELKVGFEEERKDRENKEEELIAILQSIQNKIKNEVSRNQKEREQNEEMIIKLVEQVIEKLKKEMLEFDI